MVESPIQGLCTDPIRATPNNTDSNNRHLSDRLGTHLNICRVQGKWSLMEAVLHINLLEVRVVRNSCAHFLPFIRDTLTKIMTDNTACMFYINCQGGARSLSLLHGSTKTLELVHSPQCTHISHLPARGTNYDSRQSQTKFLTQIQMGN